MRSASLAWLLNISGIKSSVLAGGYKAYRNYILEYFKSTFRLMVLGGMTGSGKTDILLKLKEKGKQVLDLEAIAHHKGSAFGALGEKEQNSNEQFENDLFSFLSRYRLNNIIWVEDESQNIGKNMIPSTFFKQILNADLICIETDTDTRINRLVRDYATFPRESIEFCIKKISRRLGGLVTQRAIESLEQGDFRNVAAMMLDYYDKTYTHSLEKRNLSKVHKIKIITSDIESAANKILKLAASLR
jgi:tRNA 2-selenouridine synthase